LVSKLLGKVGNLGIAIDCIAPSHGPIWREQPDRIVSWYGGWAEGKAKKRVVVAFDTMWQSTAAMARAIADGVISEGIEVAVTPLRESHRSDVATVLMEAGALVMGSPTLNNGVFPTVVDALSYLKGLKPRNLGGAAFGSYGWSGEAVGQIEAALEAMNVDLIAEGLKVQYVPDDPALARCADFGRQVAREVRAKAH
jgi:flavorubredoxin